jgi:Cu2+-exporting ATPase
LSLAAPTAFAAAGSHLLRHGILLTRGHALETLAKVNHVVFDKTGTLTYGKPVLQRTVTFSDLDEARCLVLAASLEQASEHPLAQSFLSRVAAPDLIEVQEAQNLPGKGVSGIVAGIRYTLGNAALAGLEAEALPDDLPEGATLVWLCDERRARAVFVLSDGLRPQASELVEQLRAAGVLVTILSGDAADAVAHVAAETGIESWQAALRPEDKLKALRELQQRGHVVAMVGDGVNDAPVLAGADVSIAMGGGTQVARASSDIVLLTENLLDIQRALKTGHASIAVMRQNFAWAIVYNLLALPFAAVGMIPPWLASIGMSTSSLVVVLNALRLR